MPKVSDTPPTLNPYFFHHLDLQTHNGEALTDCPFCGKINKFSVNIERGVWRCFVCNEGEDKNGVVRGGNPLTFLRTMHRLGVENSDEYSDAYETLASQKKLLNGQSLAEWEVIRSLVNGDWLLPAYYANGKLSQLYRYIRIKPKYEWVWKALPTPIHEDDDDYKAKGHIHGLHGVNLFDDSKENVYLCEGFFDAVALWETLQYTWKEEDGTLLFFQGNSGGVLDNANVLGVPGANVFDSKWLPLFAGKNVYLCYDNDHPKMNEKTKTLSPPVGFEGMKRVAGLMMSAEKPPASIHYLNWGIEGYNKKMPDGYDLRDHLAKGDTFEERVNHLGVLFDLFIPAPAEWINLVSKSKRPELSALPCDNWQTVISSWKKALRMRQCLEDVLAVMFAVAASTSQTGDQLFLQLIGDAGSAKTKFCDAMLVSKGCYALEHLTGFHSGYMGKDGEDYSLIARVDQHCMITPEGDVLMSSPKFIEIMSQQRRIFDGTTGASYKNRNEDMRYTGLRTPWIMAGTSALMETDQSRLGDRFIRICIDRPVGSEEKAILRKVIMTSSVNVEKTSNGKAESQMNANMCEAYQLTGGYVDYLRKNITNLVRKYPITEDDEELISRLMNLSQFVADMRARPNFDPRKYVEPSKELPSRLAAQFTRLAKCLAVVLDRDSIDDEVMRIVTKVAVDTAHGPTLKVAKYLYGKRQEGMAVGTLATWIGEKEQRAKDILQFLSQIDVVEIYYKRTDPRSRGQERWRLTERTEALYEEIIGD